MESEYLKASLGTQCLSGGAQGHLSSSQKHGFHPPGITHSNQGVLAPLVVVLPNPDLEFWDSLHVWRRDKPKGTFCQWNACARTPQMCFCSCALPTGRGCSTQITLTAPSLSQHSPVIPQVCFYTTAALSRGRCRILTEHRTRSTEHF